MTIYEFNSILISFAKMFQDNKKIINKQKKRKRREGAGLKHTLDTIEKKLFFIAKWFDTGFIGANSDTVMMPKKKPKGKALSQGCQYKIVRSWISISIFLF